MILPQKGLFLWAIIFVERKKGRILSDDKNTWSVDGCGCGRFSACQIVFFIFPDKVVLDLLMVFFSLFSSLN